MLYLEQTKNQKVLHNKTNPPVKDDYLSGNIKGIIAGVGSIIIGIMLLIDKLHW